MYLILHALNEDATLNNFQVIGSIKFIKDQPLTALLRLNQNYRPLRYTPEAATTLSLTLKKSDNTSVVKLGTFPFPDDRSIIKFSFTALEMANVISQSLAVTISEPVAGTSVALLEQGLQVVKPESC